MPHFIKISCIFIRKIFLQIAIIAVNTVMIIFMPVLVNARRLPAPAIPLNLWSLLINGQQN
jgi:hypothetical protein